MHHEHVEAMFRTHPHPPPAADSLADCVTACNECAAICTSCADACLNEQHIDALRRCIRLNQHCADL